MHILLMKIKRVVHLTALPFGPSVRLLHVNKIRFPETIYLEIILFEIIYRDLVWKYL